MTEDEALALARRFLGTSREVTLIPFEYGWLAEQTPSAADRTDWTHIGQACLIIDSTGVVTQHPSLPVSMLIKEYAEARRAGQITGQRLWPNPDGTGPGS
jgi:hypothetical protein